MKETNRNMAEIEAELRELEVYKHRTFSRAIHVLKRVFDDWANKELVQHGYPSFKMAHMPVMMNISMDGSTNQDVADKARVSKQAISKVVKELAAMDIIEYDEHPRDGRSAVMYLTEKGKLFQYEAKKCIFSLIERYRQRVGAERLEAAIDVMLELIDFHIEIAGEPHP